MTVLRTAAKPMQPLCAPRLVLGPEEAREEELLGPHDAVDGAVRGVADGADGEGFGGGVRGAFEALGLALDVHQRLTLVAVRTRLEQRHARGQAHAAGERGRHSGRVALPRLQIPRLTRKMAQMQISSADGRSSTEIIVTGSRGGARRGCRARSGPSGSPGTNRRRIAIP